MDVPSLCAARKRHANSPQILEPCADRFTGQEMMDGICGINFNARVLDPTIGRFFSADMLVANPLNGQSFNRYSYVNNGPLSATDPSGLQTCPSGNPKSSGVCPKSIDESSSSGYGPPCWGCAGPGAWGVSRYGVVISAAFAGAVVNNPSLAAEIADIEGLGSGISSGEGVAGTSAADATASGTGTATQGTSTSNITAPSCADRTIECVTVTASRIPGDTNGGYGNSTTGLQLAQVEPPPEEDEDTYEEPVGRRGNPINIQPGTNSDTELGGRMYTGHALDQMQGRGVTPSAVEEAIQNGYQLDTYGNRTMNIDPANGITVITEQNGTVVTVITKPSIK